MKVLPILAFLAVAGLAASAVDTQAASGWTFQGCFTFFPAGPCRDAYTDPSGQHWICKACGTTVNPGPSKCSKFNPSVGYWCS